MRDIEKMRTTWGKHLVKKKGNSGRKSENRKYFGQYAEPLFDIPLANIVPCLLHVTMSIVKLLRKILLGLIRFHTPALEAFEKSLAHPALKIKVYKPKQASISLTERLKKTRFSRVNSLSLIKNQEIVLECIDLLPAEYKTLGEQVRKAWRQGLCLLAVASNPDPELTIKEGDWKKCAIKFAETILSVTDSVKITSYLHCFAYHLGFYLEKYSGIERLGNYSTEGNIKWIKEALKNSSSHFGGKNDPDACFAQLLQLHYRSQESFKKNLPRVESDHHWSCTLKAPMTLQSALFDGAPISKKVENPLSGTKKNFGPTTSSPLATTVTPKQLPTHTTSVSYPAVPVLRKLPFSFPKQTSIGNQLPLPPLIPSARRPSLAVSEIQTNLSQSKPTTIDSPLRFCQICKGSVSADGKCEDPDSSCSNQKAP